MEKIGVLQRMPLFASLSKRELLAISKITRERRYTRNQVIIRAGERGTTLFLLTSGVIRISIGNGRGKEIILGVLYPHDFFGEMALLDSLPRSATVVAVQESEVLVIPRRDFLECIRRSPKIATKMIVTLSLRLRRANRKVGGLVFMKASGRVAHTILELAEGRSVMTPEGVVVDVPFTRRGLADMAGVSRETLARMLTKFQRTGLLQIQRQRFLIPDPSKLEGLV